MKGVGKHRGSGFDADQGSKDSISHGWVMFFHLSAYFSEKLLIASQVDGDLADWHLVALRVHKQGLLRKIMPAGPP
eukprot:5440476-Amphidinium_carterae.1